MEAYVVTDTTPPSTPAPVVSIEVSEEADAPIDRVMTLELSDPITLSDGEHLYVVVQMVGVPDAEHLCVVGCDNPAAEPDRNWWSNGTAPPYDWATLHSFGLDFNAEIWAAGYVL